MMISNANPAATTASSVTAKTETLFGSATIAKIGNSVLSSTTARVGCGAGVGVISGAMLMGPCGIGAMVSGPVITSCYGAKLGAIGGSMGGSLSCAIAPTMIPAIDLAAEAIKDTAKDAVTGMNNVAVGCSRVVVDCVVSTSQNLEEPVMVQPRSVHPLEVGDPSRIRRIVPNRNIDSHPVATSDTQPYFKKAEDKRSR